MGEAGRSAPPAQYLRYPWLVDTSRAREELGWSSRTTFRELMQIMVEADLELQEAATGARRGQGSSR